MLAQHPHPLRRDPQSQGHVLLAQPILGQAIMPDLVAAPSKYSPDRRASFEKRNQFPGWVMASGPPAVCNVKLMSCPAYHPSPLENGPPDDNQLTPCLSALSPARALALPPLSLSFPPSLPPFPSLSFSLPELRLPTGGARVEAGGGMMLAPTPRAPASLLNSSAGAS